MDNEPKTSATQARSTTETEVLGITSTTMKRILSQAKPADLIALYVFLAATAHRQKTQRLYCTDRFAGKGLGWSVAKVQRTKRRLRELNLIETVARRDNSGRVEGWYVLVRYLTTSPDAQKPDAQKTTTWISEQQNACLEKSKCLVQNVRKKRGLSKPSLDEIRDFASSKGLAVLEAEKFFHHHNGNGWTFLRNGGSWKSKFRGWCDKASRLAAMAGPRDGEPKKRKSLWDYQPLRSGPSYRDIRDVIEPEP